ncbi:MAG: cytochrome c [Candidatus Tokpelaia sp. JSC161]|jgi:cytochrome c|nr:MAG: cytochrome c [Candidatus Tokpelaia sp. JSC161]
MNQRSITHYIKKVFSIHLKNKTALSLLQLIIITSQIHLAHRAYAQNVKEHIFQRCIACHYPNQEANKIGPSLKNILQRQAGTRIGYRFSPAMIQAGKKGLIWNEKNLTAYLRNPQGFLKGTRMPPIKITSKKEIEDLIAYLKKA